VGVGLAAAAKTGDHNMNDAVPDMQLAGRRLHRIRTEKRLSLRDAEAKSGVAFNTIRRIEHGNDASAMNLVALCNALNVSVDWLFGPLTCSHCDGLPPEGFRCETCGTAPASRSNP
jgi:transcriptional regulator with XRE-family HTH domain